jgi:hypothetical protein
LQPSVIPLRHQPDTLSCGTIDQSSNAVTAHRIHAKAIGCHRVSLYANGAALDGNAPASGMQFLSSLKRFEFPRPSCNKRQGRPPFQSVNEPDLSCYHDRTVGPVNGSHANGHVNELHSSFKTSPLDSLNVEGLGVGAPPEAADRPPYLVYLQTSPTESSESAQGDRIETAPKRGRGRLRKGAGESGNAPVWSAQQERAFRARVALQPRHEVQIGVSAVVGNLGKILAALDIIPPYSATEMGFRLVRQEVVCFKSDMEWLLANAHFETAGQGNQHFSEPPCHSMDALRADSGCAGATAAPATCGSGGTSSDASARSTLQRKTRNGKTRNGKTRNGKTRNGHVNGNLGTCSCPGDGSPEAAAQTGAADQVCALAPSQSGGGCEQVEDYLVSLFGSPILYDIHCTKL